MIGRVRLVCFRAMVGLSGLGPGGPWSHQCVEVLALLGLRFEGVGKGKGRRDGEETLTMSLCHKSHSRSGIMDAHLGRRR